MTQFLKLELPAPKTISIGEEIYLQVEAASLQALTERAFEDISHLLRAKHLKQLKSILDDTEASTNDRYVALELLKNAVIAAEGAFPSCQDTGTAIVSGSKGQNVLLQGDLKEVLEAGIKQSYATRNLRFSQMAPLDMYSEQNTGTNLPAQIDISATSGSSMELLYMAKGGGSANKTFLFQETRRLLEPEKLRAFFDEKIRTIGTTACPPYHLAFVIGGLSAEHCLKTVKLASARVLDDLPNTGDEKGRAFRDLEAEQVVLELCQNLGLGAQFGGKYFCHDVRVIRLPRHGGSLPIGMGVSCSADRQALARIDADGFWIEKLETDPAQYLPSVEMSNAEAVHIDLNQPMDEICAQLSKLTVSTPVLMSGPMIVARDLVHAELAKRLANGQDVPEYFLNHPVYYAGPAKTPKGHASGSFGPTTAARMDPYVPNLQAIGASRVMIAKGNRARSVTQSCQKYSGFYLGSVGGAAASLGRNVIRSSEVIDFPEFGMEAVHRIEVENFPAFIIVDDKGGDFFTRQPQL